MRKDLLEQKISRRIFLLGGVAAAASSLILGRMFFLQVIEGKKYRLLAEKNRISWRFRTPVRGKILDRQGIPFAENKQGYTLILTRENLKDIPKLLDFIDRWIPLSAEEKERILKYAKKTPKFSPVIIKENLTWEQLAIAEIHLSSSPEIYIDLLSQRTYPYGEILSSITGYVSLPSKKDLEERGYFLGYVGQQGLEKAYQKELQGAPPHAQFEVNSMNKVVRKLGEDPGIPGETLQTTVDLELQKFCYDILKPHKSGCSIVMDCHTGEILSLLSVPSFDPNLFVSGISSTDWRELRDNSLRPLYNKATSALYPPGSIFKLVTALAILEAGISPTEKVNCSGSLSLNGHLFHCWNSHGHGYVSLEEAIGTSCDVYFYHMALKIGHERIAAKARQLGFGSLTGINLPSEKEGLVPDKFWKEREKKEKWMRGDTLNLSMGQGMLTSTPLQMIRLISFVANGGTLVTPTLTPFSEFHRSVSPPVSPRHLEVLWNGMFQSTNKPSGTSYAAQMAFPGLTIAGKTSTAQVRRISMAERLQGLHRRADRPWHHKDHAMFVGYGPVENPKYSVIVVIEHGGGGGRVAAPPAFQMLARAVALGKG